MLLKRGEYYYFRWQIPADIRPFLGSRELIRSLGTSSKSKALFKAGKLHMIVDQIKAIRVSYRMGEVSEEVFQEMVREIWDFAKEVAVQAETYEEAERLKKNFEKFSEVLAKQSVSTNLQLNDDVISFYDFFTDQMTKKGEKKDVQQAIDRYPELSKRLIKESHNALHYHAIQIANSFSIDQIEPRVPDFLVENTVKKELSPPSNEPKFSELYDQFIDYKINNGLVEKIQQTYSRYYKDWCELNDDKPISNYKRKEFRDYCLSVASIPKRNLKPYKGKSISELLDLDFPEKDKVSPKQGRDALKWLQGMFAYATAHELIDVSPLRDLKLQFPSSEPWGPYSDLEVKKMLLAANDSNLCKEPWKKWVINIAAYTGMRRGEIVQLRKDDIKFNAEAERYYFHVTDIGENQSLKTKAAVRLVPMHQRLLNMSFLDYVDGCESDSLFEGLKPQTITAWFNGGFRPSLDIDAFDEYRQKRVFHSFRHTVITKALAKGCQLHQVQQVVGHEKQNMGITSNYNHIYPLKEVLGVIDCIDY